MLCALNLDLASSIEEVKLHDQGSDEGERRQ